MKLTKSQRRKAIQYLHESGKCKGKKHAQMFFNGLDDQGQEWVYLDSVQYYQRSSKVKVTGKNLTDALEKARVFTGEKRPDPSFQSKVEKSEQPIPESPPKPSRTRRTVKPLPVRPLKKPFLVHLTPEQIDGLKQISERTGESQAFHIRAAIQQYLGREND